MTLTQRFNQTYLNLCVGMSWDRPHPVSPKPRMGFSCDNLKLSFEEFELGKFELVLHVDDTSHSAEAIIREFRDLLRDNGVNRVWVCNVDEETVDDE